MQQCVSVVAGVPGFAVVPVFLLLYPCFMVRNPYRFTGSSLSGLLGCKKDVFYRFMSNPKINWRKSVYHLTLQLWSKIRLRSGRKEGTVCLIVDDTDYPKTGRRMENIGRVFSHVHHRCIRKTFHQRT